LPSIHLSLVGLGSAENHTMSIQPSFEDRTDFENANRGFIDAIKPCVIARTGGGVAWDNESYSFAYETERPETANPKLWRQLQLVAKQGLYRVTDGIYQARGFDISNMTIVEGERGVIVIDPLISSECAEAAIGLYFMHRPKRPITCVIYTHSHTDHFGGVLGVLPLAADNTVPIIAPDGFMEEAVGENIVAGNAMARRAVYMYGLRLEKGPRGNLGCGLGTYCSTGTSAIVPPNVHIVQTGQEMSVDGVRIIFQVTPGAEAPSEMNFYFPDHKALCLAENATHNFHNILTLRGALIRDARMWSRYIDEALALFVEDGEAVVAFASHHWPTWGRENIIKYLSEQRDLYAFVHDQTVRMMNDGLTGIEIAEAMVLPDSLQSLWHTQGFYGTVSHNVKAIYQRYMGWYDGNPAHLWEHPPVPSAQRYCKCMGGVAEVIRQAKQYENDGDLRFASTLLNHAVYAEPANENAKNALAQVFEKLGYGCENAPWRNIYLSGALELRAGLKMLSGPSLGAMSKLSVDHLLDWISVRVNGLRAQHECFTIDLQIKDLKKQYRLNLSNGVLTYRMSPADKKQANLAGLILFLTQKEAQGIFTDLGARDISNLEQSGDIRLLHKLLALVVPPKRSFPIVTPREQTLSPHNSGPKI
jgi:alkyl sulfatase BDS1-like metallo-beta-lactamase superfamily hydrolase